MRCPDRHISGVPRTPHPSYQLSTTPTRTRTTHNLCLGNSFSHLIPLQYSALRCDVVAYGTQVFTVTLDVTSAVLLGAVPAVLVAAWNSDVQVVVDLRPHAPFIGIGFVLALGSYYLLCGRKSAAKRANLQAQLQEARDSAEEARERAESLERKLTALKPAAGEKPVRIFMEGAFDLMHYGHMNAFRLGQSLGTRL